MVGEHGPKLMQGNSSKCENMRSTKVFCDSKDRIFACFAHPPNEDGSWDEVMRGFWQANERLFELLGPRRREEERRGDFESFTAGLSIGQGQTVIIKSC